MNEVKGPTNGQALCKVCSEPMSAMTAAWKEAKRVLRLVEQPKYAGEPALQRKEPP
jgi:hypothetical protein